MGIRTVLGRSLLALASAACFVNAAQAGAVITFGNTTLGVNDTGELNFGGEGPGGLMTYGVYRSGLGDAISPGCLCEGWGVALGTAPGLTVSTFANQWAGSGGFASSGVFGATANTATSIVSMADAPVSIRHAFGPSLVADIFQVQVTITNNGSTPVSDLMYRRVMDWDIPPTEFSEYVTHGGVVANLTSNGGNVAYASNNGFASANPLLNADSIGVNGTYANPGTPINTINTDFNKAGVNDHGSVFDFSFGSLAAGQSRVFNIYYGSAQNESQALSKVSALGVNVYSFGQASGDGVSDGTGFNPADSTTFIFGFGGVGGTEIGSSQDTPVLPFVPAPGQFVFDAPVSGRWFDPPMATGFTIDLAGGNVTLIKAPDGFNDLTITVNGVVVDSDFDAGETFTFAAGVASFKITGMHVDTASAAPFPLYMEFDSSVTGMTWTAQLAPVPEASTLAMSLMGLALMAPLLRRRQTRARD